MRLKESAVAFDAKHESRCSEKRCAIDDMSETIVAEKKRKSDNDTAVACQSYPLLSKLFDFSSGVYVIHELQQLTETITKELNQLHTHHGTGVHVEMVPNTSEPAVQMVTNAVPHSASKEQHNSVNDITVSTIRGSYLIDNTNNIITFDLN
jgi:hypothetical protein